MSRCAVCRAEHDQDERGRVACRRCERRTTTDLQALADAYALLVDAGHTALTPGQHGSNGGRGGVSADERSPVRMGVLSLTGPGGVADWLRSTLARWYDDLEFKLPSDRPITFANLVTRLVNNLPWAAENRADFREFARRVHVMRDRCEVALDPSRATPRVPIGRCPALDEDGDECGAKLTADPFADHIRCRECGSVWNRSEWMLLGAVLAGEPGLRS